MSEQMLPQPDPLQGPPVLEPKSIKVFGIIHIVFGVVGLLMTLFTIATLIGIPLLINLFAEMIEEEGGAGTKEVIVMLDAMKGLFSDLTIPNWVQAITSLVVSVLILLAGIALVKKRKAAVQKSNRYVWCSIGAKVINLILFFAIGMAANKKYHEAIEGLNPGATGASGPGGMDMTQLQSMISSGGAVVGIAFALVYPILTYVFLNKQNVKDYLKLHGS